MRVLRFMGPVARPDAGIVADALRTACTVTDLLVALGYVPAHHRFLQVISSGRRLALTDPLPADGEIILALPMGGG